jgi:putative addiction module killer protein
MDLQRNFQIRPSGVFTKWLTHIRDPTAQTLIARRIARLAQGNFGNTRSVGHGVFELKIDFGPGYRVYYVRRHGMILVLLCGGDKHSQSKDIERAKDLATEMEE